MHVSILTTSRETIALCFCVLLSFSGLLNNINQGPVML